MAIAVAIATVSGVDISGQTLTDQRLARLKADVTRDIDARHTHTQQMTYMVFSFGELGYQEFETSRIVGRTSLRRLR